MKLIKTVFILGFIFSACAISARPVYAANSDDLTARINSMQQYFAAQKFDKALAQSQAILAIDPSEKTALAFQALSCMELGRFAEAIAASQKLVELRSDYAGLVLLGQAYGGAGEYEKAEAALNKASEMSPQDFQAHYVLAMIYVSTNQKDKAMQKYEKLKALGQDRPAAEILHVIQQGRLDP